MNPWDDDRNAWARRSLFGNMGSPTPPPQDDGGFFGRLTAPVKAVGSAVGAVGGFLGDMAEGLVEQVGEAAGSLKDLFVGINDLRTTNALMKRTDEIRKQIEERRRTGQITPKEAADALVELSNVEQKQSKKLSESGVMKRDPIKSGAAVAQTALDVATLGAGTALKQGGKTALRYAGEKVAQNAGEGAVLGGTYGALEAYRQGGSETDISDAWRGALFGGAAGGVLGGAASFLDPQVRAGMRELPDAARREIDAQRALIAQAPERGSVRNPFYSGDADALDAAEGAGDLARRQLSGEDIDPGALADPAADEIIRSTVAEYSSPEKFVDDIARTALNAEKGKLGGQLLNIGGEYRRVSEHAPWYSNYYAENGRAPSLEAVKDLVRDGNRDLVLPEEREIYERLLDREAGFRDTIEAGPPMDLYPEWAGATGMPVREDLKLRNPRVEPPGEQRRLIGRIQEDPNTVPAFREALAEEPQTYASRAQQPLAETGREVIRKDPNRAMNDYLTKSNPSDQDNIIGGQLMARFSREGRIDDAVDIALHMDTTAREQGRSISALQAIGNLTPEGILRYAARKVRQASEKTSTGRGFEKGETGAQKAARKMKQAVETAGRIDGSASKKVVDELTTGEKIAEGVENMASPKVKKKADLLVKEILKKVREESMPQTGKKTRNPVDVLRDVFARNAEAQEAFPEAQRILMDRAKDSPRLQEVLQQFFESELGLPASSRTINNAIRQQLKQNEVRIGDVILESWNGQKQSVEDIAAALTKEGFDPESAQLLGKEIVDRLNVQVAGAKQKALENLARDVPDRAQKTFLDKLNKISNLGGLNDADYLEMARSRLKLPNLTSDMAEKLSELSQKMQGLPDGFDKDEVAREIYGLIDSAIPKSRGDWVSDIVSAPKSLMAAFDLSGMVRQGGVLGSRFRKQWRQAFGKSVEWFTSEENFRRAMSEIKQDADYELATRAKLALTGIEGAEEAFVSKLPHKIPLAGKGVQASDRAYTGGLTKLRFDAFKSILSDLRAGGFDMSELTDERLRSIGKYINTSSGVGTGKPGGLFEKMAPALNRTLFSPRLWKSRLDMLNPVYYYQLDPIARKYALESAGTFASIATTVFALASLMGGEVETDARSSDFLKIRFGDTRYDILGGFQQNLVFAHRLLSGERKSSVTGKVTDLNTGDYGSPNRLTLLTDLIENKSNPVLGTAGRLLEGTDRAGDPVNVPGELLQLAVPLNVQDTYDVAREYDPVQALYRSFIPGTLGVGVNTYGDTSSDPFAEWRATLGGTTR